MRVTRSLMLLLASLVIAAAIIPQQQSEEIPPRSEIMSRISRLLHMLHKSKSAASVVEQPREQSNPRASMVERRARFEEAIRRNPGLRVLLESVLKDRKEEEARMLQSDPGRRCRPGLFFCKKNRMLTEDANADVEGEVQRAAALKRVFQISKMDDTRITKRRRCRPGLFWCEKGDASYDTKNSEIAYEQKKPSDTLPQPRVHYSDGIDDLSKFLKSIDEVKQDPPVKKQNGDSHIVDIVSVPGSKSKDSTHRAKAQLVHDSHGEKLADDLMKSLDAAQNTKESSAQQDEKSNYDINLLTKILEGSKR